ncbi:hypothetical protein OHA72_29915 [Dactylosporangium sp. NBC_01737]|uniref:hypothetical protein n=1 Tax=Dactylosporangium sp. NBC_01737 TaxID=2975959 RepID=UPI002E1067A0|nr:hypothetical protein OHA72_29915 [Dactylosporangium sp. NBC_01737]
MARRTLAALAVALLGATVLISGCGTRGATDPPPVAEGGESADRLRRQAREALDRYDRAVAAAGGRQGIVVVGERTGQVGTWEEDRPTYKASLLAGKLAATAALPGAPRAEGEVTWDGGGRRTVAIIAADAALAELVGDGAGDCPECETIEVTGARLGTARINTTRGAATAPAWEFTLRGSAVLVTRVAFAASSGVTVEPPPWDADNPPRGLRIDAARVTGTTLTAQFVGSPRPATGPCGVDYTAEVVESANAVVVIVVSHPFPGERACTAIGGQRTATVQLAAPLGERAVLEVQQGTPVPVTVE